MDTSFKARLKEAIGTEIPSSFGRRSGLNGNIRRYLRGEGLPGMTHLVNIAEAANVSIEWLATGCGTKQKLTTAGINKALAAIHLEAKKTADEQLYAQFKAWLLARQNKAQRLMNTTVGESRARKIAQFARCAGALVEVDQFELKGKKDGTR